MRFSELFGPTAARIAASILATSLPAVQAVNFNSVPPPDIDLSALGRVALTGDFDSISLYTYEGQNQNGFSTNGSQALLQQLPNGVFTTLQSSDAMIMAMCPFVRSNGDLAGVVVGGNFTSLGGIRAAGAALWDPTKNQVVPLPGLQGSVNALYCDQGRDTVYVGGDFTGSNSTNAIAWVGMAGWTNLPFEGFNGPVDSIVKAPDGKIIFGGAFTGLGNKTTPANKDQQLVNLQSANITSGPNSTQKGFSDPRNVVCSTSGLGGAGKTWLTADNGGGFWRADLNFGFEPTKLRIYNAHQDGSGTKTFRFKAFPINGIMNFTYTDPDSKQNATCDNSCPLSHNPEVEFQDFTFVNNVGMNSFQIDIRDIYGSSGGFNGIDLFQNDIYAYAVSDLNEPTCANLEFPSNSTQTGPWSVTPSGNSAAQYLTANLTTDGNVTSASAEVTFLPDIRQSGNYTVTIYTPGCQQDNSCSQRGKANVTGTFSADGKPVNNIIFQTNDFDKYDQIYTGPVDANSDSFRARITLSPGQNDSLSLVALRVRFQLLDPSSSGLNGLFEFDPGQATVDTDFKNNTVDSAGSSLDTDATITSLAVVGKTTFVGGNFSTSNISNIFAIPDGGNMTALTGRGLNNAVTHFFPFGNLLFVAGNFTDTVSTSTAGIKHVAVYDVEGRTWSPLGGGVNGPVERIVPLLLNTTMGKPETCITVNGHFTQVLDSGTKPSFDVDGFAIWVPSHNDWLQNLDIQAQSIKGSLTAATNITGDSPLLAGTIQSQGWALSDAVALSTQDGNANLAPIGLRESPAGTVSSKLRKREVISQNVTGAVTGLFVTDDNRNITVLAGHFDALASDDTPIHNVVLISTDDKGKMTASGLTSGISNDSIFRAVSRDSNTLSLGGEIMGTIKGDTVTGIVQWDLGGSAFVDPQPPALTGHTVAVYSITTRPSSSDLYVGGNFTGAGQLQCPSICVYSQGNWNRPGQGVGGTISNMLWQGKDQLLVAGDLSISSNDTFLGTYEVSNNQAWSIPSGASVVPGPVTALVQADTDGSSYWISGNDAKNGSAYLIKYDGDNFRVVPSVFGDRTTVRGLSVVSTSKAHDSNDLLEDKLTLMITGTINVPSFGNASAVLFNGTTLTPLILANSGNNQGSLSQVVTEMNQKFNEASKLLFPIPPSCANKDIRWGHESWLHRRDCSGYRARRHVSSRCHRPPRRASPSQGRRL